MTDDVDEISILRERIVKLKKRTEKLQTQKALILSKESENILGKKFSYELVLSILSSSWSHSSDKQKEEWIKSAASFRHFFKKRKAKKSSVVQSKSTQAPAENP